MPTITWITPQGLLPQSPIQERRVLTPIRLEWASVINVSWIGGTTRFIHTSTENISLQAGWAVTGNGIDTNTVIVAYNSNTSTIELSKDTLIDRNGGELFVQGEVFGVTTVKLLSGSLPRGLRLLENAIVGTPTEVKQIVESRFVVRLSNEFDTIDRTFKLTVEGPDSPTWITNGGLLPATNNSTRFFVLDNDRVDFLLTALDEDIPAGDTVRYYIPNNGGELPPGLKLTETGRIYGFTDPIFALEYNTGSGFYDGNYFDTLPYDLGDRPKNGYDTFVFDEKTFDYSNPVTTPRRLNRYYQFVIAATDGINEVRRQFYIYVVTEDFLRSDNDILTAGTGLFRADSSSTRAPIWITETYLGRKRANNYLTLYLDVYDPPSQRGTISYSLLGLNQTTSGQVYGRTAVGANSIYVDLTLDSDGNYITPNVGEKISLISSNTYSTAYPIHTVQQISNNRYRLDIGGTGANATASFRYGQISFISVISGGSGYLIAPTVTISGGGGSGATATATIKNGRVISVSVTNPGQGYTISDLSADPPIIVPPVTVSFGTVPSTIYNYSDVIIGSPSDLPPGMVLDSLRGEASGTVPYQPRITKNYEFTIRATSTSDDLLEIAYADKTFNIEIIGEIESGIEWITPPILDPITPNIESMLSVKATSKLYGGFVNYSLLSTNPNGTHSILPPGLTINSSGDIVGKVRQYEQDNLKGITTFDSRPLVPLIDNGDASTEFNYPNSILDSGGADAVFTGTNSGGGADAQYLGQAVATTYDGATTTFDKSYKFTVRASDVFNFAQIDRTFTVLVSDSDPIIYSNLYVKAFQKKSNRNDWYRFITDSAIFEPNRIYRYNDKNFGVQSELKMLLYAGIESVDAVNFVQAMSRNHYRKKLRFGNIKKAVAKDPATQKVVYEVVYVEMVDNLESNGTSISSSVNLPDNINSPILISYDSIKIDSDIPLASERDHQRVFPNSIKNMRNRVKALGQRNREHLPLWMRSIQPDTYVETGFVKAVPLCYAMPDNADYIIANIKARLNAEIEDERFDFKMLNFEIDRYVIDSVGGYIQDKYLVFPQRGEKV
jgi:hypothetical protein